ncbi:MAG: S41 family peptidase [Proteobacteria bacterium]|nr:S41 family peptidase [Pseudomonadota bacterium]
MPFPTLTHRPPGRAWRALLLGCALVAAIALVSRGETSAEAVGQEPAVPQRACVAPLPLGVDGSGLLAMRVDEVAETAAPKGTPSPGKPVEKKAEAPFYAPYLRNPASLGFSPDAVLFETVLHQVKTQHVDLVPDDKLWAGLAKEVLALLTEARVPADDLQRLPHDRTLPQEVVRAYGGRVDPSLLWYAMIRGVLAGTDDPYSVLMTPKEYHGLMEQMQNASFGGIGIFIECDHERKEQLTVVEPLEGTPAARAGILPGDQIVTINGLSTQGWTLDQATLHIRGQIGTSVVLGIRRGEGAVKEYTVARAAIEAASVTSKMLADHIGYIRLRMFGAKTGKELDAALETVQKAGARAVVIDLRNNGGGYINAAVDVCSHFVPNGGLVTYVTKKHGERSEYNGSPRSRLKLPVLLLVNQFSASASEITAGCFKDYGIATLIGVKTFGKGSVQQLYPLPSGAALKLTIAHFFTPKGHKINKVGVDPDIKVEMDARNAGRGEKDVQMQKALDYIRTKGLN